MAFIGLLHPVAAKVATETRGQALTYEDGAVIGKAIQANVNLDRSDNPLYGDDEICENDNGLRGGTIELGLDDLLPAQQVALLGHTAVTTGTGNNQTTEYDATEKPAPYVGFGYVRVRRKGGVVGYEARWYHKVQFGLTSETAQTKGQSIEWQTPTVTGRIMGVHNDASGEAKYYRYASFATEAAALAWLDAKAGIE